MVLIKIKTKEQAEQASKFLESGNAFEDSKDWNETELKNLTESPFKAINQSNYFGWIMVDGDKVIGYIDLREHDLKNDGYYIDWFVVHKDYRNNGIGSGMLKAVESFATKNKARYILVETGDIEIYKRTRKFYEDNGYAQVGHIPEYYYTNWGMCIYQKVITQ